MSKEIEEGIENLQIEKEVSLKRCMGCDGLLPEDNFTMSKKRKSLSNKCNNCKKVKSKEYCKRYYEKNRVKILEKQKEYNKNNEDQCKKYLKEYYQKKKEKNKNSCNPKKE
jgi:Fe-S-cluster-containing hydrogenase component 2